MQEPTHQNSWRPMIGWVAVFMPVVIVIGVLYSIMNGLKIDNNQMAIIGLILASTTTASGIYIAARTSEKKDALKSPKVTLKGIEKAIKDMKDAS